MQMRRITALAAAALILFSTLVSAAPASAAPADDLVSLANQARASAGLGPLGRSGQMDATAHDWANQMMAAGAISHRSSLAAGVPGGWSSLGENVAHSYGGASQMHSGWMASAGHRANILGDFTTIGVGFVAGPDGRTWGVQIFGKYGASVPAPAAAAPAPAPAPPAAAPAAAAPVAPAAPVEAAATPAPTTDEGTQKASETAKPQATGAEATAAEASRAEMQRVGAASTFPGTVLVGGALVALIVAALVIYAVRLRRVARGTPLL